MQYILTETNHNHGFKGMVINREQYIKIPYFDRALYQIANDESEFDFKVSIQLDEKKPIDYLIRHKLQLRELMELVGIDNNWPEILGQLKKNAKVDISYPKMKITFNLIADENKEV